MRKEDFEKVESVISKALESKPHEIRKTYRLGKKSDHGDLIKDYGRLEPQLCLAFMWVTDFIYETHQHLVTSLDQPWLLPQQLRTFADAIHQKGGALTNCWQGLCGWHCEANIQTRDAPGSYVQWAQTNPCPQILVRNCPEWTHSPPLWSRRMENARCIQFSKLLHSILKFIIYANLFKINKKYFSANFASVCFI